MENAVENKRMRRWKVKDRREIKEKIMRSKEKTLNNKRKNDRSEEHRERTRKQKKEGN